MPSPFPGMDPFLEHPAIYPDFRDAVCSELKAALNRLLPARYYAGTASRVWIDTTGRRIQPDVQILLPSDQWDSAAAAASEQLAVSAQTEVQPVTIQVPQDEFRELMVEIYADAGGEKLVTHIEVLSLSNKQPAGGGRKRYLKKQREILDSQVHLVEIDLLRGGQHTIAVPPGELRRKTPPHDYRICLHRFDQPEDFVVYPIPLGAQLPTIPIPLLPGDPDVMIDLQSVFVHCYEVSRYAQRVRYQRDRLVPPLTPEQQVWADDILAKAGLWTAR